MSQWIVVRNWDRFQHYKERRPVWIKNYLDLLDDPDYLRLGPGARSLLHGIWLMYASHNGRLPLDTRYIARQLNMRATSQQVESLVHAGFLTISASKPLAIWKQNASPEVEKEEEKERTRAVTSYESNGLGFAISRDLLRERAA